MTKIFILLGAIFCLLAVIFGAFGAHALKSTLTTSELHTYNIANQYHFYHAIALIMIGLIHQHLNKNKNSLFLLKVSGWLMLSGILLFSGSLYLIVTLKVENIGVLTPLGGICFILGWLFTVLTILNKS